MSLSRFSRPAALVLASWLPLAGCTEKKADSEAEPMADAGAPGLEPPKALASELCDRVQGGPTDAQGATSARLANAHATARFFGVVDQVEEADEALAQAIGNGSSWKPDTVLTAYAKALTDVCVVDAVPELSSMQTEERDGALWVTPGTGALDVPDDMDTLVVDLRAVPETDDSWALLEGIVSHALAEPVKRAKRTVRHFHGYPDETWTELTGEVGDFDPYYIDLQRVEPVAIKAAGKARTLILLTGARMAPSAAEMAGTLRLAGKAFLVGEDVLSSVAESRFRPVAERGLSIRTADLLLFASQRWPDVIDADARTDAPETAALDFIGKPSPKPLSDFPKPTRKALATLAPADGKQPQVRDRAHARAAVLVAYGAMHKFYPYFDIVGSNFDPQFEASLEALDGSGALTDETVHTLLKRLVGTLDDGHAQLFDLLDPPDISDLWMPLSTPDTRLLPFTLEVIESKAVVVASQVADLEPGDEVVAIDDVSFADFATEERPMISSATPQFTDWALAFRFVQRASAAASVRRTDSEGNTAELAVSTIALAHWVKLRSISPGRPSGWLEQEGATDVYYINAHKYVPEGGDSKTVSEHLTAAIQGKARALIVDDRSVSLPEARQDLYTRLAEGGALLSPQWGMLDLTGPDEVVREFQQDTFMPTLGSSLFTGPIAVLVSRGSTGRAETLAESMRASNAKTKLVGETTGGTNGDITSIELPGRWSLLFTGLEARNADGSRFHGVGIVPDIEVHNTQDSLRAGRDVALEAAIEAFK